MKTATKILASLLLIGLALFNFNSHQQKTTDKNTIKKTSGAGKALDIWSIERSYPNDHVKSRAFLETFRSEVVKAKTNSRRDEHKWESLGPENVGGRTLCLAFHPTNEDIIFAGSASGGLWKSTTQGQGRNAWEYVSTGFPVLGVASIAIDQHDPNIMYIGTGEVYGSGGAEPGTIVRITRGSYGIGILKTIDGGATWSHALSFEDNQLKGVQDLVISPKNSSIIFAATSDGVYRSLDAGDSWSLIFNQPHCFDLEIDPRDGTTIYVTQGNFNGNLIPSLSGIFKSTDGGNTFNELLDPGLITAWSGNAKLALDPNNPDILYASVQVGWFNQGPTTPGGVFMSTNGGQTWTYRNNQNIAQFQGWYSHDIAVNPLNSSEIINVGIAAWKSTNSAQLFTQHSTNSWNFHPTDAGIPVKIPVDIPEGDDNYVHSDIHAVYYHPINNKVFYACDGGVFVSTNGEAPFTTLNGGLQTSQIYADMSSSATNPDFCMIGMQDNASYVYDGTPAWSRFIGGDGMSTKINQEDDNISYASWQGLNVVKMLDRGLDTSWLSMSPALLPANDAVAFSGPYELAPSDQNIMYAGSGYIHRSDNGGDSWNTVSQPLDVAGNVATKIAISFDDPDLLLVATTIDPRASTNVPKILKSEDGGKTFTPKLNGLPNRIAKDLTFHPENAQEAYVVFSGFGSDHVFVTYDGGELWQSLDNGTLPDVPTNTIFIDPQNQNDIYVGNDLGIYYSDDRGLSWESINEGLKDAVMVYDINYSPSNRKIRIATHGHGVYERDLLNAPYSATEEADKILADISVFPNPANEMIQITIDSHEPIESIEVLDLNGSMVATIGSEYYSNHQANFKWHIPNTLARGYYFVRVSNALGFTTEKISIQ